MAGEGSSCVGIDRTSSIELEPRTLDFRQIQFAREAALYVLNTKSMEEAFQIFTKGLEPVTVAATIADDSADFKMEDSDSDDEEEGVEDCNYIITNRLFRSTSQRWRDVATAPF